VKLFTAKRDFIILLVPTKFVFATLLE